MKLTRYLGALLVHKINKRGRKMENAPILSIWGSCLFPGADPDARARYINWIRNVYMPELIKTPGGLGIDLYHIVRESPEQYPSNISVSHLENILAVENALFKIPENINILRDVYSWQKRGINEAVWGTNYILIKGFRNTLTLPSSKQDTRIENAPVIHLEAYRLSSGDADNYNKWFIDYAFNIFIPLFMKLPGIKGYDYLKDTGVRYPTELRESEYPTYLSVVYFENLEAFENYEKSSELATLRKNLRNIFPQGLNYKWFVQYQLVQSWRK
jgi:heme-degrading monooxygenase HmoA